MRNKKDSFVNNKSELYNLTINQNQSNPNIKSFNNNKIKISQNIKNFNNSFTSDENSLQNFTFKNINIKKKENNFSKILKILDEEIKKSLEYKSEINSLKKTLNSKNKEIKSLNNKIVSLNNNITNLKKENHIIHQNNQLFYRNFIEIMSNFKQYENIINIKFPAYSLKDEQTKKYKHIIHTTQILIKTILDLCNNTNSNITKFNSLKKQINSFNESFTENNQKKEKEINSLKMQNNKLKKILEQNIFFLKELREENHIIKNRNLNLEKNINLISKSREKMRRKILMPIGNIYTNNNLNLTEDNININNISINTTKTNKTTTDILIEEFQDKENKILNLHKIAHNIYNGRNKTNKNK